MMINYVDGFRESGSNLIDKNDNSSLCYCSNDEEELGYFRVSTKYLFKALEAYYGEQITTRKQLIEACNDVLENMYSNIACTDGYEDEDLKVKNISLNEFVKFLSYQLLQSDKKYEKYIEYNKKEKCVAKFCKCTTAEKANLERNSSFTVNPIVTKLRHNWSKEGYRLRCPINIYRQYLYLYRCGYEVANYYKNANTITVYDYNKKEISLTAMVYVNGDNKYCPTCAMNLHTCNMNTCNDTDEFSHEPKLRPDNIKYLECGKILINHKTVSFAKYLEDLAKKNLRIEEKEDKKENIKKKNIKQIKEKEEIVPEQQKNVQTKRTIDLKDSLKESGAQIHK